MSKIGKELVAPLETVPVFRATPIEHTAIGLDINANENWNTLIHYTLFTFGRPAGELIHQRRFISYGLGSTTPGKELPNVPTSRCLLQRVLIEMGARPA